MMFRVVIALLSIVSARRGRGCGRYASSSSSSSCIPDCDCGYASSSASSSSDLICCDKVLLDYDFNRVQPTIGVDWTYYTYSDGITFYQADDGVLTFSCAGAALDSMPFDTWVFPGPQPQLDHYKYWVETIVPVLVKENDTITAEWKLSAQTFKTDQSPYPPMVIQEDDVRMAYGGVTARDPELGLLFGFALTNDRVYGIYQRADPDPVEPVKAAQQALEGPIGFTILIPLKHRVSCDIHRVGLVFNEGQKTVGYVVDGIDKFIIGNIGMTIPYNNEYLVQLQSGEQDLIYPFKLLFGFGTFTALDWYPACKDAPACKDNCMGCAFPMASVGLLELGNDEARFDCSPTEGCPIPAQYYSTDGQDEYKHIWGQGVMMQLGMFRVTRHACF